MVHSVYCHHGETLLQTHSAIMLSAHVEQKQNKINKSRLFYVYFISGVCTCRAKAKTKTSSSSVGGHYANLSVNYYHTGLFLKLSDVSDKVCWLGL